jgi:phosphoglucosamine mutase
LLAALQVLAVLVERQRSASEVCQVFQPLPQTLKNVRFSGISPLRLESVQRDIKAVEARLDGTGRVLIRESGTEPLVRVMAEGEDKAVVTEIVDSLCAIIAAAARQNISAAE